MTETDDPTTPLGNLTAAYATITEHLTIMGEAASGYRKSLVDQGWSEYVAEALASTLLHHWQGEFLGGKR